MNKEMNREIKFRAWDSENKQMVLVGSLLFLSDGTHIVITGLNPGDHIRHPVIMQYTGLQDKNGKEIYDKDLLLGKFLTTDKQEFEAVYEVSFGFYGVSLHIKKLIKPESTFCNLVLEWNMDLGVDGMNFPNTRIAVKNKMDSNHLQGTEWQCRYASNDFEVIGDIFTTPELLK